jgi:hypothetical protein
LFFEWNLIVLFFLLLALLIFSGEAGKYLGRRSLEALGESAKAQIAVVQGALLGLLALLMGFTFAMAISRFDDRKNLVVDEANAIGTAFLRTQILPEPERSEAQKLLRAYVNDRVQSSVTLLNNPSQAVLQTDAEQRFDGIWRLAMAAVERDIHPAAMTSFFECLNQMNDLRAGRDAALANHVPESALYLLVIVAGLSIAFVGYGFGTSGFRGRITVSTLCLVITLVIIVIVDMDRPRRGLIRVSQQSLLELQQKMNAGKPTAAPR